jgi:copper chaperone CopZ
MHDEGGRVKMAKKVLSIDGMSCMHCVKRVKAALSELSGVASVEVELDAKRALVEGPGLDDAAMKAAVEEAGYHVLSVSVDA